jgi:hypothetical protein
MPEVFMTPQILSRNFPNPQELDLFNLETTSRKTIAELLKPMVDDMNQERIKLAKAEVHMDRIDERIA